MSWTTRQCFISIYSEISIYRTLNNTSDQPASKTCSWVILTALRRDDERNSLNSVRREIFVSVVHPSGEHSCDSSPASTSFGRAALETALGGVCSPGSSTVLLGNLSWTDFSPWKRIQFLNSRALQSLKTEPSTYWDISWGELTRYRQRAPCSWRSRNSSPALGHSQTCVCSDEDGQIFLTRSIRRITSTPLNHRGLKTNTFEKYDMQYQDILKKYH